MCGRARGRSGDNSYHTIQRDKDTQLLDGPQYDLPHLDPHANCLHYNMCMGCNQCNMSCPQTVMQDGGKDKETSAAGHGSGEGAAMGVSWRISWRRGLTLHLTLHR